MDMTPVTKRVRSKLSRSRPSPGAASTPVTPTSCDRRASEAFSTPHRPPPSADAWCWESPTSPFSPAALSQACEIYWDDELPGRAAELLKAQSGGPGDRVPPLPAQLAASPAPLVPAARQRTRRATRQQHQQVLQLLDSALQRQKQATQQQTRPSTGGASSPPPSDRPPASPQPAPAALGDSIESDQDLDRSLLRCSQLMESEAPRHSFNAFVMEAMPDDEDDIFSQIPAEALDGGQVCLRADSGVETSAQDSSSGVSCASSSVVSAAKSALKRPSDAVVGTVAVSIRPLDNARQRPQHGNVYKSGRTTMDSGSSRSTAGTMLGSRGEGSMAGGRAVSTNGAGLAADPLKKAEINRRRAEALRRRRQRQMARAGSGTGSQQ